jgi:hypothetical protein
MNRMFRNVWLFAALALTSVAHAQEVQLPRTLKAYPLRLFAGELLLGYEHGIGPHISVTAALGLHGSGVFNQASRLTPGTAANYDCRTVFPASGLAVLVGPRWYPGKLTRKGPFFLELLLVYRRTDFEPLREYGSIPCNSGNTLSKEVRPLVQRTGVQLMCGGALRRDKRFTMDMFGGLGLRSTTTDERQTVVPPSNPTDSFYYIEPKRTVLSPSVHLGLSLGYNFAALRRR